MLKIFCNFRRLCYNKIAEKKALLRLRADFANKSFSFLFLMSRRKAVFLLYNIKNKRKRGLEDIEETARTGCKDAPSLS